MKINVKKKRIYLHGQEKKKKARKLYKVNGRREVLSQNESNKNERKVKQEKHERKMQELCKANVERKKDSNKKGTEAKIRQKNILSERTTKRKQERNYVQGTKGRF